MEVMRFGDKIEETLMQNSFFVRKYGRGQILKHYLVGCNTYESCYKIW